MKYSLVNENFQDNYVERLIESRGGDYNKLLNIGPESLNSPDLLDNIEKGANLFLTKIKANDSKKIGYVVDCDTDGFTSSAILWQYGKLLAPEKDFVYFVHSGKQHGLEDMIDSLAERDDISLVVVPDAGSSDYEYHKTLKDIGIPVLVLDHHEAIEVSENAIIINNQLSSRYPNKQLTGAGVVYQFCRYIDENYDLDYADEFIDLAALGIIADMGSVLEPENQYIIRAGLAKENKNKLFQEMLEKQEYSIGDLNNLNSIAISFYIAPLINALIRVGTMEEKEKMFEAFIDGTQQVLSTKRGAKGQVEMLATQVTRNCVNARARQNRTLDKAIDNISIRIFNNNLDENSILVIELDDEEDNFPPELNGLTAMKLAAAYKKPTLVLRKNSLGYLRGSARGLNNSDLKSLKDYLVSTGLFEYCTGHANAFGCSIKESDLTDFFKKSNIELANYNFTDTSYDVNFIREAIDTDIPELIRDVYSKRALYGQFNDEPLICIRDINFNVANIKIIGKDKDTVKIENNGIAYMKFKGTQLIEDLSRFTGAVSMEVVGRANYNTWMGYSTPQIFIEDYNIQDLRLNF